MANDDRRDAFGKDQQVVAQVEGGRAAFQFGTWLNIDTEPVDWRRETERERVCVCVCVWFSHTALMTSVTDHKANQSHNKWGGT